MRQTADVRPSVSVPHGGKEGEHLFCAKPVSRGACCAFHFILTLGIAVWAGTWPMMIVPFAVFATANWVHIPFEEAKMRRQFGASYDDYLSRVRRWV